MNSNFSIFIATDAPRIAGSEIWLAEVLPRLAQLGVKITLALPKSPKLLQMKNMVGDDVHIHWYSEPQQLPEVANAMNIRLIQAWNHSTYNLLLQKFKSPKLVFVHDQLDYHYPLGLEKIYRIAYNWTKAKQIKKADLVLVGTAWAAEFLRKNFNVQALNVGLGVDTDKFKPAKNQEERKRLRAKFGFNRYTFIYPARFSLEKNHQLILRVAKRVPNADFVLLGDGELRKIYASISNLLRIRNIRFETHKNEIIPFYQAADAIIFPTLADNPGLILLEGMSTALPIISSDFPPQRETVPPQAGILVKPTVKTFIQAVTKLIRNPEEGVNMGRHGRQWVLEKHKLSSAVRRLYEALQKFAQ